MFWNRISFRIITFAFILYIIEAPDTRGDIATLSSSGGTLGSYNGNDTQRLKFKISNGAASAGFDSVRLIASSAWTGDLTFGIALASNPTNVFASKSITGATVATGAGTLFDLHSGTTGFNREFATGLDYWLVVGMTTNSGSLQTQVGQSLLVTGPSTVFAPIQTSPNVYGSWDYAGPDGFPVTPSELSIGLTASVPEPGTLILFGSAALAGGVAAWRKKRKDKEAENESGPTAAC